MGRAVEAQEMIPRRFLPLVLGLLMTVLPGDRSIEAQGTPLDSARVLWGMAQQLMAEGESDLGEAVLRSLIRGYPESALADSARAQLQGDASRKSLREARTEFVAWSTIMGTWIGLALPVAFDAQSSTSFGLALLGGGPLGFVISREVSRNANLSPGAVRAGAMFSLFGAFQGLGWQSVLGIGDRSEQVCLDGRCFERKHYSHTAPTAVAMTGSIGGLILGNVIGQKAGWSRAVSTGIGHASWWGSWFGFSLGVMADIDGHDYLTSTLVGGDLGLLIAALALPSVPVTEGQVWLASAAGLGGLVAGVGLAVLLEVNSETGVLALPTAGSFIGLAAGWAAGRGNRDIPVPIQSAVLSSGSEGGLGLGIPAPYPLLQRVAGVAGQVDVRPALALNLLDLSF